MGTVLNVLKLQCPRCRKGKLFKYKNYLGWKNILTMYDDCKNCNLHYEIENGFWWGTGYINYLLSVLLSVITCLIWHFTIGFSVNDNSIFIWLFVNAVFIIALQPWIMRIGRSLYLHFFVGKDSSF